MRPGLSPAPGSRSMAGGECRRWRPPAGGERPSGGNEIMTDKKPVVVYGASGYTGRLVCEYLRELHVPFIAAGRDRARTQEVVDKIPGIETAEYEVVGVEHNVEALTKLFRGSKVVCNMVGPFIKYGGEV